MRDSASVCGYSEEESALASMAAREPDMVIFLESRFEVLEEYEKPLHKNTSSTYNDNVEKYFRRA